MTTDRPIVGIDLGTTHSLIAVFEGGAPRLLSGLVPSAVALDATEHLLIGAPAHERLAWQPDCGVERFKRDMGTQRRYDLGARMVGPVELSSLVLKELVEQAEEQLGWRPERAVITVPAYFQEPQRAATQAAGTLAGLEVVRMINEPTAAAIAYGLGDAERERTCMVVDLGGGTLDVTILEIFEGLVEVTASAGDSRLGGEDFTDALVDYLLSTLDTPTVSASARAKLRRAAEQLKRALSEQLSAGLIWPEGDDVPWPAGEEVIITRKTFETLNDERLDHLQAEVERALRLAKLDASQIDELVLVGGATRMPGVVARVQQVVRAPLHGHLDPDTVVAQGAAVQGALIDEGGALDEMVVTDVVPFSLGVSIVRQVNDIWLDNRFLPVIHRNTVIPVCRTTTVATTWAGQTEVLVEIYQGERRLASENQLIGTLTVSDIPPLPADAKGGQAIELMFTHDANGLLEVEATVQATKTTVSTVIERGAALTPEERATAIAAMAQLKTHPRSLLPNRLLLERAQRIFAEGDRYVREALEDPVAVFEAILERREPAEIREAATALRQFLNGLGR
jgi:molecular chaperone HscC